MGLLFKVQHATISSIGRATVPVAITRMVLKEVVIKAAVVVGCTVKEAWDLVVLMVETAVAWDRELKALACTVKVVETVPWEATTMVWLLVVDPWVVEVVDHRIVLSSKTAVAVVVMAAVEMPVTLKSTLGI